MFIQVLIAKIVTSLLVAATVWRVFRPAVRRILETLVGPAFAPAWITYIRFAAGVLAVSCGVDIYQLDMLTRTDTEYKWFQILTPDRWVYQLYQTTIHVLQALAIGFLVFFLVCLVLVACGRMFSRQPDAASPEHPRIDT